MPKTHLPYQIPCMLDLIFTMNRIKSTVEWRTMKSAWQRATIQIILLVELPSFMPFINFSLRSFVHSTVNNDRIKKNISKHTAFFVAIAFAAASVAIAVRWFWTPENVLLSVRCLLPFDNLVKASRRKMYVFSCIFNESYRFVSKKKPFILFPSVNWVDAFGDCLQCDHNAIKRGWNTFFLGTRLIDRQRWKWNDGVLYRKERIFRNFNIQIKRKELKWRMSLASSSNKRKTETIWK